jgi:hypothetical protein
VVIVPPLWAVAEVTSNITSLVVIDGAELVSAEEDFLHPVFKKLTDINSTSASRGVFI